MQNNNVPSPIRVVLDAMGGDYGPRETIKGAVEALNRDSELEVILVGDEAPLRVELEGYDLSGKTVSVVPSEGKIGDDEHPIRALRQKPRSSIMVATRMLNNGEADTLVSMGSTGASMASAVMILGLMEGVERPCIGGPFLGLAPNTMLVDMGSNVDCRPALLLSFAAMGVVFARRFMGIENPKVGLLSVGAEEAKGNRQVQESYQLFQDSRLNFVGNVEGMDFFTGRADVIVSDGFVGNILMKFTEGLGSALGPYLLQQLSAHLSARELGNIISDLWETTNLPRKMGGPLFGVNGAVILGHGSSTSEGVAGAIATAVKYVKLDMVENLQAGLAEVQLQTQVKV